MKWWLTISFMMIALIVGHAQEPTPRNDDNMQTMGLEDSERDEDVGDDDYDLQQLEQYKNHPVNLNRDDLAFPLLGQLLLNNLKQYRKLLGDLIDVYELQAVPGFTPDIIRAILPYVSIKERELSAATLLDRARSGDHTLLLRCAYTVEKAAGYKQSSASSFIGSRMSVFTRYKYQFRNLLQYGVVMEKDAGEQFFTKHHMPQFFSAHLFARDIGNITALAIGDFTVSMGQGLIHWQTQVYGAGGSIAALKRSAQVLRPYNSAGEIYFNRGVGMTIRHRSIELTAFASRRNISANISDNNEITSIQTTGLHRTLAEVKNMFNAVQYSGGLSLKKNLAPGYASINFIGHRYSLPLNKDREPYNMYAIRKRSWKNASVDYGFTYRNFHFFGEVAGDENLNLACLAGILASMGSNAEAGITYRQLPKAYQTISANAATENSQPSNEKGIYAAISFKPHLKWRLDVAADLYSHPWLKYQLNAPGNGASYLIHISYKPTRTSELYSRIRYRMKPVNITEDGSEETPVPAYNNIYNWRSHFNTQMSRRVEFRCRMEICSVTDTMRIAALKGWLAYAEIQVTPRQSWVSGNMRITAFESPSYSTRIYNYESDLLFVNTIQMLYNNGVRYYANLKGKFRVKSLSNSLLTVSVKASSTIYTNLQTIGSGNMAIAGNRVSAIKMQFFLSPH